MHGTWEFYRKDDRVMRAGTFERGRQVGVWRTFDRSRNSHQGNGLQDRTLIQSGRATVS